jgi:catechol 2,3-dioxygenase-like lactoylglutathione lyase family enzyme
MIQHISAITFGVGDMARSIAFYRKLGFRLIYGGDAEPFSTLQSGEAYVNLTSNAHDQPPGWWGRVIFRVPSADDAWRRLRTEGLSADMPQDAPWGERYFHITDPDGHELSFAQLLQPKTATGAS